MPCLQGLFSFVLGRYRTTVMNHPGELFDDVTTSICVELTVFMFPEHDVLWLFTSRFVFEQIHYMPPT